MAVQAIWGNEHSRDRQYPRQPAPQKVLDADKRGDESRHENHEQHQQPGTLPPGSTRLLLDDMNHVVMIQVVDSQGQVVKEIPSEDLAILNYHGVLVDLTT